MRCESDVTCYNSTRGYVAVGKASAWLHELTPTPSGVSSCSTLAGATWSENR